jgi:predicted RNA-binding protein with PIN domain
MKHYIIDGNNLIGKNKNLSELQRKDKQSSREQLLFILQSYFASKKIKVSLHFDGFEKDKLNFSKGKIIYSASRSADEKIKEEINSIKNKREITIISSDSELRNYGKVCSCIVISSEDFLKEIEKKG